MPWRRGRQARPGDTTPSSHAPSGLASPVSVTDHYNKGGVKNTWLSAEIEPLNLSAQEQGDLVAFLQSLTGQVAAAASSPPKLPD